MICDNCKRIIDPENALHCAYCGREYCEACGRAMQCACHSKLEYYQ